MPAEGELERVINVALNFEGWRPPEGRGQAAERNRRYHRRNSERMSTLVPVNCSGLAKAGVPTNPPWVRSASLAAAGTGTLPKSAIAKACDYTLTLWSTAPSARLWIKCSKKPCTRSWASSGLNPRVPGEGVQRRPIAFTKSGERLGSTCGAAFGRFQHDAPTRRIKSSLAKRGPNDDPDPWPENGVVPRGTTLYR
jgi:hypothetical protein